MSRDFSPRECWVRNKETVSDTIPHGIYLQNYSWVIDGKEHPAFTPKELQDRRDHPYLAVTGGDIYKTVRKSLSDEKFEKLDEEDTRRLYHPERRSDRAAVTGRNERL